MKKLFLLVLTAAFCTASFAQVSPQTGGATFSLPMFNWQDNKSHLNATVALNYSSGSGLKVNDIASNVGQGWNLQAGGVITRMQVGEPDDQIAFNGNGDHTDEDISRYPAGMLYAAVPAYRGCPSGLATYPIYGWKNQVYAQRTLVAEDKQLDYFSFQFNGKTGMFVLDPTNIGTAKPLGDTKMKITFLQDNSMINSGIRTNITSFQVQDEDGLIYKFTVQGLTKILQFNYCDKNLNQSWTQPNFKTNRVYYQSGFDNGAFANPWVIDSWYLYEILDPLTNRKIDVRYKNNIPPVTTNGAGDDISYTPAKDNFFLLSHSRDYSIVSHKISVTKTPQIANINYPDGHKVIFNYSTTERYDLKGAFALKSVEVQYQGRSLSKYLLNTTYIILNRYGTPFSDYQIKCSRLYLKSFQKIGVDLKEDTPPYIFDYYLGSDAADDFVPPPFCYAKDIWGFFNGSNSVGATNETIPLTGSIYELNNRQTEGLCFLHIGGNGLYTNLKNSKPGYAKNGLLRQVIYPTAGTLTYSYEQNTLALNGSNELVGGVHVSQISSTDGGYSNGCANAVNTNYKYVTGAAGDPSSLWGMESPVNSIVTNNHYKPEYKDWRYKFPFGECYWHFTYPGIASQQQQVSMSGLMQTLNDISPYLGIISALSTIKEIITVFSGGNPVALIIDLIIDVIALGISCIGDGSKDDTSTIYYNSDLNASAPLPAQFRRVEIIENNGANGKIVQTFTSDVEYQVWVPQNSDFSSKQRFAPWAYGLPRFTSVYNATGNLVKQTEYQYDFAFAKTILNPCTINPASVAGILNSSAVSLTGVNAIDTSFTPAFTSYNYCDVLNSSGLASSLISCKCLVLKNNSQRNENWSNPAFYNNAYQATSSADLTVDFYGMYSGRVNLLKTIERDYKQSDAAQVLEKVTDYTYNSSLNYEVNTVTTTQSNGDKTVKSIKYSADYGSSLNSPLVTLVQNNMLKIPVSVLTSVTKASGSNAVLEEKVTEFTQLATGDIQPLKILEQRFSQPNATATQYSPDNVNNATIYKTIQSFTYDALGNLVSQKDEGNRTVVNIYDYQDKYAVASIINADLVDNCAYTSFETNLFGGWSLTGTGGVYPAAAITGARSLTLNGNTLTRSALNTTKPYILSFWATAAVSVTAGATLAKTGPIIIGFTYYEYNVAAGTTSIAISGNANIDELRVYPQMARINTVTYDPLIGKTSDCDENNRLNYYEYDNLGRLKFLRDENKNVVKMYEYNTVSPVKQSGCPGVYYNHTISETFTKSNCGAGFVGSDVVYTVAANTFSSTISQEFADALAEYFISKNGQNTANATGSCRQIFYSAPYSKSFPREKCPVGYVGSGNITYNVPANRYTSLINQTDADQMAMDEADANGDAYANSQANTSACIINTLPNWIWPEGGASYCSSLNGALPPHLFLFQKDNNPNSSTYNQTRWWDAGPQSECPAGNHYNAVQSQSFQKSCPAGYTGSFVTYTVQPGTYSSTTSQLAANQLALNDITSNGQNYANANGTCTQSQTCSITPAFGWTINYSTIYSGATTVNFSLVVNNPSFTNWFNNTQIASIVGGCRPSAQRIVSFSENSRNWIITINTYGSVYIYLQSGAPPATGTVIGFGNITYNL